MKKKRSAARLPISEPANASTPTISILPIRGPAGLLWGLLAATAVIFWLTLCRTVPGGDSGELITMAYRLGVPHPPGYPLYTLLAHAFTWLPFGEIAFRVNLMSAVWGLANAAVLFLLVERWLRDRWLALLAAGLFVFSPLAWRYAVSAEVFTLNNFLISMLLYVTYRFVETPERRWALAWAGILGLASSHHHTIVLLALPLFVLLLKSHHGLLLQRRVFLPSLALFLAGFLPYLYLPWASGHGLLSSWGEAHTWDGFWRHVLRQEYGTFRLATTGDAGLLNMLRSLRYYASDLVLQFVFGGVVLVVLALGFAWRERKRQNFVKLLLFSWLFYVLVFHYLANMDLSNRLFYDVQSRFWLLPNTLLVLLVAWGIKELLAQVRWRLSPYLPAFVLVCLSIQVGAHYQMEDHSKNRIFYDLGRHLLADLPKNSLVLLRGDVYVNSVRYQQDVLGFRTDVKAIPFDLLWWPWMKGVVEKNFPDVVIPGQVIRGVRTRQGEFTILDLYQANFHRGPMYVGKLSDDEFALLKNDYQVIPIGFLNLVQRRSTAWSLEQWQSEVARFKDYVPPTRDEVRDKSWEAFVFYNYWDRELEKARFVFDQAQLSGNSPRLLLVGVEILERMLRENPEPPPPAYRNLGVAYQILGASNPVYRGKMVEVWRQYLKVAPANDPSLPQIRAAVGQ